MPYRSPRPTQAAPAAYVSWLRAHPVILPTTFFVPMWALLNVLVIGGDSSARSLSFTLLWALVATLPFATGLVAARVGVNAAVGHLIVVWIPAAFGSLAFVGTEMSVVCAVAGLLLSVPALVLYRWQRVVASSELTGAEDGVALLARTGFMFALLSAVPAALFGGVVALLTTCAVFLFTGGLMVSAARERDAILMALADEGQPATLRSSVFTS